MYDFDSLLDRSATEALKWKRDGKPLPGDCSGLLPMWVADMDFAAPPAVVEAIGKRAGHPVYGYAAIPDAFFASYIAWMRNRYSLAVDPGWLSFSPGIVPAIATAIRAFTQPGEGIAIVPPVYHPFKILVEANHRKTVEAPLVMRDGRYELDLEALDRACSSSKMLIFCSPHNPVGRVWTADELAALAAIAKRRNTIIFSDEIHADLVLAPHRLVSLLGFDASLDERLVVAWAPSKTFNIAGLQASYVAIPDAGLRSAFAGESRATGMGSPNCMVGAAAIAAYEEGGQWLDELLVYLKGNYEYLASELGRRAPALKVFPCEGTYLAWIDFRGAGLAGDVGPEIMNRAGLWIDAGSRFGTGGDGFARLNFGCPRSILAEAVDRIARAFGKN